MPNTRPGTEEFLPFGEALGVARFLGLASRLGWAVWCKSRMRPPKVPADPRHAYQDGGWQGWGHWLGTGNTPGYTKKFLPSE